VAKDAVKTEEEPKGKKFKWDSSCLQRDECEIDLRNADPNNSPFTMYELSRSPLLKFVEECIDRKFLKEDGETREDFTKIAGEQAEVLHKYFSESTKTPSLLQKGGYDPTTDKNYRSPEFFAGLDVPARAFGDLIECFFNVQHLEEILSTGGNWLMIPTVREVQRRAESESDSQ